MSSRLRNTIVVCEFFLLAIASYYSAFALRFGGAMPAEHQQVFAWSLGIAVIAKMFSFYWFRLHQGFSRYVSFYDCITIAKATTCSSLGLTFIASLAMPSVSIPRGVVLIDWCTTVVAIGIVRAAPRAYRALKKRFFESLNDTPALIVGANDEGEALLRAINSGTGQHYRCVGFVDDRPRLQGRRIEGIAVVGTPTDIATLVAKHNAEEVLVTGGIPGRTVRQIVDASSEHGFRVKVLPTYEQLLKEKVSVQPRSVAIEDLLRRDSVELEDSRIHDWLSGQTVLVTGSSGSIGSEICRQLLQRNPSKLVVLDRSETGQFFLERELRRLAPAAQIDVVLADMTDRVRLEKIFAEHQPNIVFHAAAYKHVPLMEQHPGEGIKNIVMATRNIADLADESGASAFVMISTDKAVNPTSVMGSCKKLAERYVQAKAPTSNCRFSTVRFGNVLDSAGSVVPIFREQIQQGGPITITHPDIVRYFMMIPEAAQLVIQAGAMGQGGEIFVLDMGEPIRIVDLARDMVRLSGLKLGEDIEIDIVGLRPGEKLFEELYGDAEQHTKTRHKKIMVAESETVPLLKVIHDINHLADIANEPADKIRDALGQVIPRYEAPAPIHRAA